jgi:hypothetical protein
MKYYIAGKITNNPNYKKQFEEAQKQLEMEGHRVMSPAILPYGFDYEDYMKVCFAMIDVCEAMYMLENWTESPGANREFERGQSTGKLIQYQKCM